jgi:quinolinate synthase
MGNWLSRKLGVEIPSWSAVCEVHDQFDKDRLEERFVSYGNRRPFLIAHPESPMNILDVADYIGSTAGMLKWVDEFDANSALTKENRTPEIHVATEFELIRMMRERRPRLGIWQVPVIADCRCNECPYMKLNSAAKVKAAIAGTGGTVINYLDPAMMARARVPVERMMKFNQDGTL